MNKIGLNFGAETEVYAQMLAGFRHTRVDGADGGNHALETALTPA